MKTILSLGGAALLLTATCLAANAQQKSNNESKYCIEMGMQGGGSTVQCLYATLEQCFAAKTSPSDKCYANPQRGN